VLTLTVNHEGKLLSWPIPELFSTEGRPLPVATTKMTSGHVTTYVGRHIINP